MFYVVTIEITCVYLTLAAPGGVSVAAEFIFKGAMNLRSHYNYSNHNKYRRGVYLRYLNKKD